MIQITSVLTMLCLGAGAAAASGRKMLNWGRTYTCRDGMLVGEHPPLYFPLNWQAHVTDFANFRSGNIRLQAYSWHIIDESSIWGRTLPWRTLGFCAVVRARHMWHASLFGCLCPVQHPKQTSIHASGPLWPPVSRSLHCPIRDAT